MTVTSGRARILITRHPENSEFPWAELRSWITPVEQFYVRNHFAVPELDSAEWRLAVRSGRAVAELTLGDLEALPARSVVAALECAGNGRRFNDPPVKGVQWGSGAVSNGEWSGPALADVLTAAGAADGGKAADPRPAARIPAHVHLTGADRGRPDGATSEIPYRRSLPRAKALDPDTLVALRLNGEPLTGAHGAPARVVVPGWYGMASVKWLIGIETRDRPSEDHFMTADYTRRRGGGRSEPLDWIEPKAEIARPAPDARLPAGTNMVVGAAWAGKAPLARVEVSLDTGREWRIATLEGPAGRYAWRLWRWTWEAEPGRYHVAARATDAEGRTQPAAPDPAAPGYLNHWIRPRAVTVA
ncbi:MAG TPA: molybdopterin-dependent oxidoreductase [Gemmatimonadota bacterium]|nr:molybdopterin-dependent oxidoreductase [Gemmatimonadota bacterium]